eukprot:Rhum_TRINITY_DN3949_c0_g1::Rhum_TRINITY_DN3949_c0_g1_i1::g.12420::m.12420
MGSPAPASASAGRRPRKRRTRDSATRGSARKVCRVAADSPLASAAGAAADDADDSVVCRAHAALRFARAALQHVAGAQPAAHAAAATLGADREATLAGMSTAVAGAVRLGTASPPQTQTGAVSLTLDLYVACVSLEAMTVPHGP